MVALEKYEGCLFGAAIGDAMGAPTEMRTRKQIAEKFGGTVTTFLAAPEDTFARGNQPGQITDDFSMAYIACKTILENGGEINQETAKNALLTWSENETFFNQFVGPTSRAAIHALRGEILPTPDFIPINSNDKASNGAAMKASPIALFGHGDKDKAIYIVTEMGKPTHNNTLSLAGAGAVASATSAALVGESLENIIEAALYGAKEGYRIGAEGGSILAGASMEKKIRLAVMIATECPSVDKAMDELASYFDCSGMAVESVPVAFGLMVAAKGEPMDAITACVNIGYDTDTMATIAGGILGAWKGSSAFPKAYLTLIEEANHYDLFTLAKKISSAK